MNAPQDLLDLAKMAEEPLCDELKAYLAHDTVLGPFVKHPLVFGPAAVPGHLNRALAVKTEYLNKALAEGDWSKALWIHERPYRLQQLFDWYVVERRFPVATLRELLTMAWLDTELPYQFGRMVHVLFDAATREAGVLTDAPTLWANALSRCPQLTVWRGDVARPSTRRGAWSWSLARGTGEWFARRWSRGLKRPPKLWTGTVAPGDVWAYLEGRGESEVVVDPAKVRGIKAHPIGAPE